MGSQQLLLLVLGTIIVGAAIVFGIGQFHNSGVHSHQSELISQINNYVGEAMAYRKKPKILGGGGDSFVGFNPGGTDYKISSVTLGCVKVELENANFFIESYFNDRLKIIASSKIYGEGNHWPNAYNARIVAVFDKNGKIDKDGFQISGHW